MINLHSRIELAGNLLTGQQVNRRVIEELQTSPHLLIAFATELRLTIVTPFTDTDPDSFRRPYHSSGKPIFTPNRAFCRLSKYCTNSSKRTL